MPASKWIPRFFLPGSRGTPAAPPVKPEGPEKIRPTELLPQSSAIHRLASKAQAFLPGSHLTRRIKRFLTLFNAARGRILTGYFNNFLKHPVWDQSQGSGNMTAAATLRIYVSFTRGFLF